MASRSFANLHSPAAWARLLVPAVVGVGLDLWPKHLAVQHLKFSDTTVRFIPGWLHWQYTENHGAVFGSGQGLRWLFISVSVLAVVFLVYLFGASGRQQRVYQILLGILLAGVLGNLYDRLVFGYVRDMIHALPGWKWPGWMVNVLPDSWQWKYQDIFPWIFNIADSLLCTGVFLMIVYSLLHRPDPVEAERPAAQSAGEHVPMTDK
jgi:signal peptidase II